jgi:hypothetical protein
MADRTTDLIIETRSRGGRDSFIIANTVTLAAGTLVQLEAGFANHWDDSGSNDVFVGIAIAGDDSGSTDHTWLGDTSGDPDPDPRVTVDTSGAILRSLSIGGTITQASVGALVYSADSDTASLTTNSSGRTNALGTVWNFRSATDVDVRLFTPDEFLAYNRESPGS